MWGGLGGLCLCGCQFLLGIQSSDSERERGVLVKGGIKISDNACLVQTHLLLYVLGIKIQLLMSLWPVNAYDILFLFFYFLRIIVFTRNSRKLGIIIVGFDWIQQCFFLICFPRLLWRLSCLPYRLNFKQHFLCITFCFLRLVLINFYKERDFLLLLLL